MTLKLGEAKRCKKWGEGISHLLTYDGMNEKL